MRYLRENESRDASFCTEGNVLLAAKCMKFFLMQTGFRAPYAEGGTTEHAPTVKVC
jgi:hypothetical protein